MSEFLTEKITGFINSIGITCRPLANAGDGFLPGVVIENGCILYNPEQLKHPGDLLHEAGHLAVLLPGHREQTGAPEKMCGDLQPEGAEMAAIAWSWAALQHLRIDPSAVFHEDGYRGGSQSLIDNFSQGRYIGVPMLQWLGLACRNNEPGNAFPAMKHWLRQG